MRKTYSKRGASPSESPREGEARARARRRTRGDGTAAKPHFFAAAPGFRAWLQQNHETCSELLVGFRKRTQSDPGMSWREAVDEALCFGWIDGVRKRCDDPTYSVRFTPRKAGSTWSAVNIRRVGELEAQGLMRAAGRRAFANRSARKSRVYSYERSEAVELDGPLAKTLRSDVKAWDFFRAQAPSYQRKVVHWIMAGKQLTTRQDRLRRVMATFAAGRRA